MVHAAMNMSETSSIPDQGASSDRWSDCDCASVTVLACS
jgi:hypothetical protein